MSSKDAGGVRPRAQLVPDPPATFPADIRIETTDPGLILHRIHRDIYPGTEFNPSKEARARFSPIFDEAGDVVSTLYAGATVSCAFYETLFHDHASASGKDELNRSDVEDRRYSAVEVQRPLRLISLFAPDLARLHLTLDRLIHCKAFHYRRTARWAQAFNRAFVDVDGLVWTSYRGDPDRAYVLFGNRKVQAALHPVRHAVDFLNDPDLRQIMQTCAARLGLRTNLSDAPSPAPDVRPGDDESA